MFLDELYLFCNKYPYLRYAQIISNFQSWLREVKKIDDIFYISNENLCDLFLEYTSSLEKMNIYSKSVNADFVVSAEKVKEFNEASKDNSNILKAIERADKHRKNKGV